MNAAPRRRRGGWREASKYAPSVVLALLFAAGAGYALWTSDGEDASRIRFRQVLDALMLSFFLGPVLTGTLRGLRRHRRHLTRLW